MAISLFALLDYGRPPEERTHLGRFVAQWSDGTAGTVLRRKAEANLSLLVDSQLTLLVIAVLVFVPLVLLRRSGGLRRVFGIYPTVRAAMSGVAVMAIIGFAVNDSGIAIPAFVAALAVPLAVATTLRVRAEASKGVLVGSPSPAGYIPLLDPDEDGTEDRSPTDPIGAELAGRSTAADQQSGETKGVEPAGNKAGVATGKTAERQEDADR